MCEAVVEAQLAASDDAADGVGVAGAICRFRDFWAAPARGTHHEAHWHQTMGGMVLSMLLRGLPWHNITADEFQVSIHPRGLQVSCSMRPEATEVYLKDSFSGELSAEVLPRRCHWCLRPLELGRGRQDMLLEVHLAKAKDGSWTEPFTSSTPPPEAKGASWETLPHGAAEEVAPKQQHGLRPVDLVSECFLSQTDDLLTFCLCLEAKSLEAATCNVPASQLFALDLAEDWMRLSLRGCEGGEDALLLCGSFGGKVVPKQTDWNMVKVTREVLQEQTQKDTSMRCRITRPALSVQLRKSIGHRRHWETPLEQARCCKGTEWLHASASRQSADPCMTIADAASCSTSPLALDHGSSEQRALEGEMEQASGTATADAEKLKGDECFKKRQWDNAIEHYTASLRMQPASAKVLCNRSAAYMEVKQFQLALDDALQAAELSPDWPKTLFRQGLALRALRRYDMALSSFAEGMARDGKNPDWENEIRRTEELKAARRLARAGPRGGM